MHTGRQFTRKSLIYHAVALDSALTFEGLRHDIHPEVGFPIPPESTVAFMLMRFVDDPDTVGRESLGQLSCDDVLNAHNGCSYPDSEARKPLAAALMVKMT